VTKLHRATTEIVYNERLAELKKKYKVSQKKMFSYFETQWLTGSFDKWQIFRNSPGFANTNSNIESFNATFKRDFTKRIKGSMLCSLNKLFTCIIYYSQPLNNVWFVCPAFDEDIKILALKLGATSRVVVIVHRLLNGHCVLILLLIAINSYWISMARSTGKQKTL
jgi:hypothetical protein